MGKIILAVIAGMILLILFLRVKIVIEAPDDLRLTLYIGPFRIRLIPKKDERLRLKDWTTENYRKKLEEGSASENIFGKLKSSVAKLRGEKKKPAKTAEGKTAPSGKTEEEETDIGALVEKITRTAKVFINRLGKHLRIDLYRIRIVVATDDAARTAITYGVVIGAVQNLWALLVSTGNLHTNRKSVLSVDTDFTRTELEVDVKLGFSLMVWQMIDMLFLTALEYLRDADADTTDNTDNNENSGQTPDRKNTNNKGDQKNGREQAHRNNPGVARADKAGR